MHTEAAIAATAHAFADGAVASVQNGLGNEEAIARHVERVIRGTTFPAGKVLEPGRRAVGRQGRHDRSGRSSRARRRSRRSSALADACTRAGMPTAAVPDARPAQWRKVIFNAATNPVGALTGLTHGRVCERPDLRALVSGLVDEGKAVAGRAGHRARRRPGGADRPRRAPGRRLRPQGEHAPGRRGAARDRDRLPERRHRPLRPRARRPDAAERRASRSSSRRWRTRGDAELERRYANVRAAMAEHDLDALVVSGSEYSGFEGAVTYLSGFQIVHRYAYVVVPAGRRPVRRLPERGALRRRARDGRDRAGLPRPAGRAHRRPRARTRGGGGSASTGSTT